MGRPLRLLTALLGLALLAGPVAAAELDQHGKAHPLDGSSGRYTVVDFAASWCQPCIRSLPELELLAASYPQFDFVVISVDDLVAGRDRLVEQLGLTLPVLWDQDYRLAERFKPKAMPATLIVDPAGEVIYRHTGYNTKVWRELIDQLGTLAPISGGGESARQAIAPPLIVGRRAIMVSPASYRPRLQHRGLPGATDEKTTETTARWEPDQPGCPAGLAVAAVATRSPGKTVSDRSAARRPVTGRGPGAAAR